MSISFNHSIGGNQLGESDILNKGENAKLGNNYMTNRVKKRVAQMKMMKNINLKL